MKKSPSRLIVFITGAFIGNNCWREWKLFFESKGYKCIAPAWPHKTASPEELRNRHPEPAIASNRLDGLRDYFATVIKTLPEKPILIGHSMGGLLVQLLLQHGIGAAGVAVHSFPPKGVSVSRLSFLKTVGVLTGLFTSTLRSYMVSFKKWKHSIANSMTCEQQKELFYKYAIPESKLVIRDTFKQAAEINFKNEHAPLLFTSGGRDLVIPASMNYKNYKKYEPGDSITEYKDFKDHNHIVFGGSAWKKEADFIFNWLQAIK